MITTTKNITKRVLIPDEPTSVVFDIVKKYVNDETGEVRLEQVGTFSEDKLSDIIAEVEKQKEDWEDTLSIAQSLLS